MLTNKVNELNSLLMDWKTSISKNDDPQFIVNMAVIQYSHMWRVLWLKVYYSVVHLLNIHFGRIRLFLWIFETITYPFHMVIAHIKMPFHVLGICLKFRNSMGIGWSLYMFIKKLVTYPYMTIGYIMPSSDLAVRTMEGNFYRRMHYFRRMGGIAQLRFPIVLYKEMCWLHPNVSKRHIFSTIVIAMIDYPAWWFESKVWKTKKEG